MTKKNKFMSEKICVKRISELDILRGVAISIMIIVDAPSAEIYYLLEHAPWEGLTIADLAFPGFVFAMGMSVAISISRRAINLEKTFKRSAILFLLGIFLNTLPFVIAYFLWAEFTSADFFSRAVEHGRFFGILQRLALTYLFGMCLIKFLKSDKKIFCAAFVILILYSAGFHLYAPENPFAIEKNISRTIDFIFPGVNHLYTPNLDPEGFYGTFSSTAEFLFGFISGKILLKDNLAEKKIYYSIIGGGIFFAIGIIWTNFDIIAKQIWTAPFTLITSGIELFLLAGILKILQISAKKFLQPLQVLGKNPLFFFSALNISLIILYVTRIENISVWEWLYQHTFEEIGSTEFSSMIFCFAWFILWIICAEFLDKKNIIIKI